VIRYTAARVVWLAVVVLGVSVVTFGLGVLAPGDPAAHRSLDAVVL